MERLLLRNNSDSVFDVRLIRYFSYDDSYYLIYTLDETDEKGYLKLYLLEVLEELGQNVCYNISDDDYWKSMETIVKNVIKEIKAGTNNLLKDLSPLELNNIKVVDPRYFKLDKKLADILSSNYLVDQDTTYEIEDTEIDNLVIQPVEISIEENKEDNMNNENNIELVGQPMSNGIENQVVNSSDAEQPVQVEAPVLEQVTASGVVESPVADTTETIEQPAQVEAPVLEQVPTGGVVESPVVGIKEVVEQPIENNNIPASSTVDASDDVNYKELYFAIKEEKEATEAAFEALMEELMKYKEKYGELE